MRHVQLDAEGLLAEPLARQVQRLGPGPDAEQVAQRKDLVGGQAEDFGMEAGLIRNLGAGGSLPRADNLLESRSICGIDGCLFPGMPA